MSFRVHRYRCAQYEFCVDCIAGIKRCFMDEIVEKSCWGIAIRASLGLLAIIAVIYLTVGF